MGKISAVISAYNEEKKLAICLKSLRWVDEIIVIDSESSDGTAEVAKKYDAKVFRQQNYAMLNKNKNYGFSKAGGEWILNLDADEHVPEELAKEIQSIILTNPSENGFWIKRKNILFGKWIQHGLWWPDKQLRLFRKKFGEFPCIHVHEHIRVAGATGELENPFIHNNYESIAQYMYKLSAIYTENEVELKRKDGYKVLWHDAIAFPIGDFLKIYFFQQAYKDGLHGLVLSILQSFYSFLVFAKLWEKEGFQEKNISLKDFESKANHFSKDYTYWLLTEKIKAEQSALKKIIYMFKRKYVTKS